MVVPLIVLVSAGLELVDSVALPVESNATYAFEAVPVKAPNDSLIFSISILSRGIESVVLRYDSAAGTIYTLPGKGAIQVDCGTGLFTVYHFAQEPIRRLKEATTTTTYDVATGERLSDVHASVDRMGTLGIERTKPVYQGEPHPVAEQLPRVYDLKTGKVMTRIGRFSGHPFYIGRVIWDGQTQRYFVADRKRNGMLIGGEVIYRAVGNGFNRGASAVIHESFLGTDTIIGNPSNQFFAVQYSTDRRAFYRTFRRNLEPTPFQLDVVHDVSDHGVLGKQVIEMLEAGYSNDTKTGCWDPVTGKRLWTTESDKRGRWIGGYALIERTLHRAKDGSVYAQLPEGRTLIATRGDTLWMLSEEAPRKLEVWKIR